MSEKKPFMDVESDFDPKILFIVRKYSVEKTKWNLEHGLKDIIDKYPELNPQNADVITNLKNMQLRVNRTADLAERLEELALPKIGRIQLENPGDTEGIDQMQALLDLAEIANNLVAKYAAAKDMLVTHYTQLALAAVKLAESSNVYTELEKREFRKKVYKTVFPTVEIALKAEKEFWEKTIQANDEYTRHLLFMKTDPVLSKEINIDELQIEPLGKGKSFLEERRKFKLEMIREMYRENE